MALLARRALAAVLIVFPAGLLPGTRLASATALQGEMAVQNVQEAGQGSPSRGRRALTPREVVRCGAETPARSPQQFDPGTTAALPRADRFVARAHFREDVSPSAKVKILWLGATFVSRFVPQIEESAENVVLKSYSLLEASGDRQMIAELGDRHETKLSHLWCLLARQPDGGQGHLLVNAIPNIFYIRDIGGVVRAVDVIWGGAGWEIGASAVEDQSRWPSGALVVGP